MLDFLSGRRNKALCGPWSFWESLIAIMELKNHSIAWVERDLKGHQVPTYLPKAGLPTSTKSEFWRYRTGNMSLK